MDILTREEHTNYKKSHGFVEIVRLWAIEWRDVCHHRIDAIEARLAALENLLLEEYREN